MLKYCAEIWDEVRNRRPLVHCITNYVTVNDVANIILAAGASPAMVEYPAEASGFAPLASALYFNLGTLTGEQEAAMLEGRWAAASRGVPLILDPVACGVIGRKVDLIERIKSLGKIQVLKGNIAEIKSLAGLAGQAQGVDSLDTGEGLEEACLQLAAKDKLIAVATGEVDIVAEENRYARIFNGTPLFQNITGAGCMAGGVIAACVGAAPEEAWLASIAGLLAFNLAGERAASQAGNRPGTFRTLLFDELFVLRGEELMKEGRVE
ncbi:MAG: hydroxyethylthiazole kinase [Syntrophomonas sp.]|uniref:hydroxyethylthiazole kinase n=1 Tax=Syntrophomonas sp. TaxID=2053627 RepID=UPI002625F29E|nr:hydroxyethylthiazole kinase [Syntrophomonas sp.]MDD4626569.1 hydroxyethylthiazole kinase [Syntrophomonas sp.]